jgi:hypothetical protein
LLRLRLRLRLLRLLLFCSGARAGRSENDRRTQREAKESGLQKLLL